MWIIPNNLQLSSGAPDTAGFISDLNEQSQICASSLMVRSKPSPSRTWSLKWKRDSWTQLLSGRILKPSHARTFVTEWTSLWPVIPASHFLQQEIDSAPMTRATSGHTSPDQYELFAPECVFSRMSKDTSALDSERSLESWNQWVTRCRGEYSARLKSVLPTKGSGSSSWPTANARDWKDGSAQCNQRAMDAGHQVTLARAATCWSTPSTMMGAMYPETNAEKRNSPSLATQVVMWPTPTTAEAGKISCCPNYGQLGLSNHPEVHGYQVNRPKLEKSRSGLPAQDNHNMPGSRPESWETPECKNHVGYQVDRTGAMWPRLGSQVAGKLNPRWVETLMGLPIGWTMPSCASPVTIVPTNCASSATESCQQQQNEHSEF